jgi:2'-5' RNA ligase
VVPYAVVLYLDDEADRTVRWMWAELDRRGVPSPGRWETGNRPHITLALFRDGDPVRLTAALTPALAVANGIPLELESVRFFLGPRAPAFLNAVPTPQLLNLHRHVQSLIQPLVIGNSPFYEATHWLPHCTLAMQAIEVASEVLSVVADRALPIRAKASAGRLVYLPERVMSGAMARDADILSGLRPPPPSWARTA